MKHTLAAAAVLAAPAFAQFTVLTQTVERKLTRVVWFGNSGNQEVSINYGQPDWREAYESFMKTKEARHVRLGRDAWTTLQTQVDLKFDNKTGVPRGRWYLGLHRSEAQQWALTLMAAEKVDATGLGPGSTDDLKPDATVPLTLGTHKEKVSDLKIELVPTEEDQSRVELRVAWDRYRATAAFQAGIDTSAAPGMPKFSLSPEQKLIKTDSGLQYEVIRGGDGPFPTAKSKVTVHYTGWLTDGTLFDSSYQRKQPASFPLGAVIKGWTEGLQLMQRGATFKFTIPPALGYGPRGAGTIPPNSTLIFEVTLLSFE